MRHLFPKAVSYNRYAELMASANLPLSMFIKTCCIGLSTSISFMDSTPLRVCKNKRMSRNKVFDGVAAYSFFPKKPAMKYDPVYITN